MQRGGLRPISRSCQSCSVKTLLINVRPGLRVLSASVSAAMTNAMGVMRIKS